MPTARDVPSSTVLLLLPALLTLAAAPACSSSSGSGCTVPDGKYTVSFVQITNSGGVCPPLGGTQVVDAGSIFGTSGCACTGSSLSCTTLTDNADGTTDSETLTGTFGSGSFSGSAHVVQKASDGGVLNDCQYKVTASM